MGIEVIARGWDRPEWSGAFYPEDLPRGVAPELLRQRLPRGPGTTGSWRQAVPEVLAGWAADVPEGFGFYLGGQSQRLRTRPGSRPLAGPLGPEDRWLGHGSPAAPRHCPTNGRPAGLEPPGQRILARQAPANLIATPRAALAWLSALAVGRQGKRRPGGHRGRPSGRPAPLARSHPPGRVGLTAPGYWPGTRQWSCFVTRHQAKESSHGATSSPHNPARPRPSRAVRVGSGRLTARATRPASAHRARPPHRPGRPGRPTPGAHPWPAFRPRGQTHLRRRGPGHPARPGDGGHGAERHRQDHPAQAHQRAAAPGCRDRSRWTARTSTR